MRARLPGQKSRRVSGILGTVDRFQTLRKADIGLEFPLMKLQVLYLSITVMLNFCCTLAIFPGIADRISAVFPSVPPCCLLFEDFWLAPLSRNLFHPRFMLRHVQCCRSDRSCSCGHEANPFTAQSSPSALASSLAIRARCLVRAVQRAT